MNMHKRPHVKWYIFQISTKKSEKEEVKNERRQDKYADAINERKYHNNNNR